MTTYIIGWNQSRHNLIPSFKHPRFPPKEHGPTSRVLISGNLTSCASFLHSLRILIIEIYDRKPKEASRERALSEPILIAQNNYSGSIQRNRGHLNRTLSRFSDFHD